MKTMLIQIKLSNLLEFRHPITAALLVAGVVCLSSIHSVDAAPDAKQPEPSELGLAVSEYAPSGSDPTVFKGATHIAFGPNGQEIVEFEFPHLLLLTEGPGKQKLDQNF